MRFPPSFIDEIKQRLPVSAVVGKRVRLQKSGREWKGLSPFNVERTPSFFVNDQKQAWFDFSSGKNGNIFTFVMETEGLSFPEAVERLAGEAGLAVPRLTPEAEEQEKRRKSVHEACELAALFFEAQLKGPAGQQARAYLDGRGLTPATRAAFRIGYAPADRFALRDHLAGKGVDRDLMIEAGLLVHGDDVAVPYDRFRDRAMFPIADMRGRVIAFGGRALSPDVPAKYLNSPETELFHKGSLLYNHHNARKAAHERGTVITVEGYVDVIAMSVAGFANTVAPLGTALTEDQLRHLWRMADEPILCFDGDKAGRRAAYRAVDVALPLLMAGKSLRFAMLPEGRDPDDLVREQGRAAVEAVLGATMPLVDVLWTREVEAGAIDTPERRAALEARLIEAVQTIEEPMLRRHYRDAIDERIAGLFGRRQGRRQGGGGWTRAPGSRWRESQPPGASARGIRASAALARHPLFSRLPAVSPREALVLSVLLHHPQWLEAAMEELARLDLSDPAAGRLRAALLDAAASDTESERDGRLESLRASPEGRRFAEAVRPGERWVLDPAADTLRVGDTLRQALTLHRRAKTLHSELRQAERALAEGGDETTVAWLRDVQGQLAALDGAEADIDAIASSADGPG